jgi:hypothetical protein
MTRDVVSWFKAVPGLFNEIQLLVWTHHGESPFIHASAANQSDANGSDIRVEMIPRSFWDEDPRFLETYTDTARRESWQIYDESSISIKHFVYSLETTYSDGNPGVFSVFSSSIDDTIIRCAEIAEALTTATKAEDLADAIAWIENGYCPRIHSSNDDAGYT